MAKRISFNNMNTEIDKSNSSENAICIQTSNNETNDINGQCHNGQTESTNDKEVNLVYRCAICREEAQEKTIACDECTEWYHYSCLKISQLEINKIDPNIPYICDICNEELLFQVPDANNEQSDQNVGKPLIDMIQTGNNMQIKRVKDCQAEVSTLDSTPNPKSTFKPNLEPSDQNAQRPQNLNTQKELSIHMEKHKDCSLVESATMDSSSSLQVATGTAKTDPSNAYQQQNTKGTFHKGSGLQSTNTQQGNYEETLMKQTVVDSPLLEDTTHKQNGKATQKRNTTKSQQNRKNDGDHIIYIYMFIRTTDTESEQNY